MYFTRQQGDSIVCSFVTGSLDVTLSKMKSGRQWLSLRIRMLRCCTCNEKFSTTLQNLVSTWDATSHTGRKSIAAVCELFCNRIILRSGDIPWPLRSPDSSVCDFFFLCDYQKSCVYTYSQDQDEETKNSRWNLWYPSWDVEMGNINSRLEECKRTGQHHLQDVILKHRSFELLSSTSMCSGSIAVNTFLLDFFYLDFFLNVIWWLV